MSFVGLLIMENKLKPETPGTIQLLNDALITSIMCTGDNPLTAVYVARSCNLIKPDSNVFVGTLENDSIVWSSVEDSAIVLSLSEIISLLRARKEKDFRSLDELGVSTLSNHPIELAITGPAFEVLIQEYESEIWNPHNGSGPNPKIICEKHESLMEWILLSARVYARMRPDQKQRLVESLMELPPQSFTPGSIVTLPSLEPPIQTKGLSRRTPKKGGVGSVTVGFCGDGANDCGALKSADVGLSLSEAEASIAAPFTSKIQNISCVISLLREGRCALVTSFQSFKFMSAYSFIQFTSVVILYTWDALFANNQFLYSDLILIIPFSFTMCRTHAYHRIVARRPTSSLLSLQVLSSLILQFLIHFSFQLGTYWIAKYQSSISASPWLIPCVIEGGGQNSECYQVTIIFLISNFQYIASCLACSAAKPFRKPFYTNFLFTAVIIIAFLFSIWITVYPEPSFIKNFFYIQDLPMSFRLIILVLATINTILILVVERIIIATMVERDLVGYFKSKIFPKASSKSKSLSSSSGLSFSSSPSKSNK